MGFMGPGLSLASLAALTVVPIAVQAASTLVCQPWPEPGDGYLMHLTARGGR